MGRKICEYPKIRITMMMKSQDNYVCMHVCCSPQGGNDRVLEAVPPMQEPLPVPLMQYVLPPQTPEGS